MTTHQSRTRARGFDPKNRGVRWTAETQVKTIADLVGSREVVFSKHRQLAQPDLVEKSFAVLRRSGVLGSDRVVETCFDRFTEFCEVIDIPIFPISMSSIALFIFAKCSFKNGHYIGARDNMLSIRRATEPVWVGAWLNNCHLLDSEVVRQALESFLYERKGVRIKAGPSKKSTSYARESDFISNDSSAQSSTSGSDTDDDSSSDMDDYERRLVQTRSSNIGIEGEDEPGRKDEEVFSGEIEQFPVTGLPQPGDFFATPEDLLIACYRALLPVYGNGASRLKGTSDDTVIIDCNRNYHGNICSWRIGAIRNSSRGGVVVDQGLSVLRHTHNRHPRIVQNPDWRPTIRNKIIRQAFGLHAFPWQLEEKTSESSVSPSSASSYSAPPPSKKYKTSSSSYTEPPRTFDTQPSRNLSPAGFPSSGSSNSRPISSRPTPNTFPSPTYHARVPTSRTSASTSSSATHTFYSQLDAFLKALHPSLTSLTSPLYDSGIDSVDTLGSFCNFETNILNSYFRSLQTRALSVGQEVSLKHWNLLQTKLEEGQSEGFAI